jgi:hypothetical protein
VRNDLFFLKELADRGLHKKLGSTSLALKWIECKRPIPGPHALPSLHLLLWIERSSAAGSYSVITLCTRIPHLHWDPARLYRGWTPEDHCCPSLHCLFPLFIKWLKLMPGKKWVFHLQYWGNRQDTVNTHGKMGVVLLLLSAVPDWVCLSWSIAWNSWSGIKLL